MPLVQISLLVPDDDLDEANRRAKQKGISRSEYVRRAIALQLDRDARTEQAPEIHRPERDDG
jgi:metal-responsive CopG/Arc/MetJ family transcriptional regulator